MASVKEKITKVVLDDLSSKKLHVEKYKDELEKICREINPQSREDIKRFLVSMKISYNNKQNSSKVINNSIYGYTGFKSSRYYNPHIAEATTTSGAELTVGMSNFLEERLGINVIYSDTDSLFLSLNDIVQKELGDEQDIDKVREFIINYINNYIYTKIDEFIYEIMKLFVGKKYKDTPKFEFKQEIIAEKGIFLKGKGSDSVKKKYVLRIVDEEGVKKDELFYRGIDIRKAELSKDIKQLMKDVISIVMFSDNINDFVLKEALKKFDSAINKIEEWVDNIDIDRIAEYKNTSKSLDDYKTDTLNKRALLIYNYFADIYGLPQYDGMVKLKIIYIQPAIPLSKEVQKLMRSIKKIDVIGIPTEAIITRDIINDIFTKHLKIDKNVVIEKMFISRLETFFKTLGVDVTNYINKRQEKNKKGMF